MKTVSKDKLRKIIQEELEKEAIDENLVYTFGALGRRLKKIVDDAREEGTFRAGDRETRRAAYRTTKRHEGAKGHRKGPQECYQCTLRRKHSRSAKIIER